MIGLIGVLAGYPTAAFFAVTVLVTTYHTFSEGLSLLVKTRSSQAVKKLRVRGDRLEATGLRHAWARVDEGLRAGLTFAAWCHQVPWPAFLRAGPG